MPAILIGAPKTKTKLGMISSPPATPSRLLTSPIARPTPNGSDPVLRDLDGQAVSLESLRGRPVWINFWATWCPPCQQETPDLRATYEAHRGDLLALVSIDVQEDPATVRAFAERYDLGYTVALDLSGSTVARYRVFGLPTHYFVGRDGVILDRYFGPLTREQMEQRVAAIIKR